LEIGLKPATMGDKWLVNIAFSVYLGWITVATIANATDLLYYLHWDGFGIAPLVWGIIMLIVGASLTAVIIVSRRDVAYTLVILWAYVGISVKQTGAPAMVYTALIMAAIMAMLLFLVKLKTRSVSLARK
jgi:hypothetical protein